MITWTPPPNTLRNSISEAFGNRLPRGARNMDVQRSKAPTSAVAPPKRIGIDDGLVRGW
jgi:hypothetical protein